MSDALDFLVKLLDIEPIEVNIFRGVSPDERPPAGVRRPGGRPRPSWRRDARSSTAGVHSLHAYFLRPGDPNVPILYEVDRIRDGRSFTTRRVVAIQHGQAIFNVAGVVPRLRGRRLDHQVPDARRARPRDPRPRCASGSSRCGTSWPTGSPGPTPSTSATWASSRGCSTRPGEPRPAGVDPGRRRRSPTTRCCTPAWPPTRRTCRCSTPCSPPTRCGWDDAEFMGASLDHCMWFHRPFRADEWLLYDMDSPNAFGARGLARGFLFTRDGTLAVSMVQEGLMRLRPEGRRP